jgi:hypothetical protein
VQRRMGEKRANKIKDFSKVRTVQKDNIKALNITARLFHQCKRRSSITISKKSYTSQFGHFVNTTTQREFHPYRAYENYGII